MHALRIAPVLRRRQRLEQMEEQERRIVAKASSSVTDASRRSLRGRRAAGGLSAARSKPRADLVRIDGFTSPCSASNKAIS